MLSKKQRSKSLAGLSISDLKYVAISLLTILTVPLFYVVVSLFFTLQIIPQTLVRTPVIIGLAVLFSVLIGYGVARWVGTVRAARWTATITLIIGSVIGWITVNAFSV